MVFFGKFVSKIGAAFRRVCGSDDVQAAGSVLDRVISQASSEDNTALYKIADYKKGGLLIETYTKGGATAAERLIRETFPAYMYAEGRGRVINRAEYLRWKFRGQEHVILPIEASLSQHDPLARWQDHEACWQMRYRGALGESLLHLLIICDTTIHTRLARLLLKCFPKLAVDVFEGEEYLGASSLHMAIAYSNNELVQELVEAGAVVSQRAIGSFFLPRDQQRNPPSGKTDYEGLAYLGEYPLAWAACCANESVYNLLLDSGADPDAQDSFGNMILHMVVVQDKLDMFGYALRHPKVPATNGIVNVAGLTPLTLACQLGRAEVFREMLELSAREFWRYSNITCSAYPLNALDTLLPDGRTNWNSALFIILNGTKEEHLDMLDGGIIQRLLEEKWKTFARKQFLKRLLILMLHLILLSSAVYLRRSSDDQDEEEQITRIIRLCCEVGTLAGTLAYIILQLGDELKNQGFVAFFKQLGSEPAKAIFLASNLLLLACIPARLAGDTRTEEAILVFAVPGAWFLLMFFAGAVRLTGPFVTMIYNMITGDMLTFGIIYCIVLFGFSQSFFFLYRGFPTVKSSLYNSYPNTWMALFQITLGDYSYSDLSQTTYPALAKSVFALFMVFVPILLLNMLIAMMGNTYAHVIEQSEKEWMKQIGWSHSMSWNFIVLCRPVLVLIGKVILSMSYWAKIVVSVERAVESTAAAGYLQEYSIGLGPSPENPKLEQRAVMVIKSKDKTRARQRKGALANWKRVGKVTITELRRRGVSGEELRKLMWGRTSISTPTKIPLQRVAPDPSGVGLALSSALDVMAFAHDFENIPPVAGQTVVKLNASQMKSWSDKPDLLVNGKALAPTATAAKTIGETSAPQSEESDLFRDFFRELVVSDEIRPSESLKSLAKASLEQLPNLQEITVQLKPKSANIRDAVAGCVSGLFGGDEVQSASDSPRRSGGKLQSDSETAPSEAPLLGRICRHRRARTASKRNTAYANWLWNADSSSETGAEDATELQYADIRIREIQQSDDNIYRNPGLRPVDLANIQVVDEVSLIIQGEGDGAETQSAPVKATLSKRMKKTRSKTAKLNRVSPFKPWATGSLVRLDTVLRSEDSFSSGNDNPV